MIERVKRLGRGPKVCSKCRLVLKLGDEIVRKTAGGHSPTRLYHRNCLTDGRGSPIE